MEFVVNLLKKLGIAKPKKALFAQFEKSLTGLDKQVRSTNAKLKGAKSCLGHLEKDELEKALEVAAKTFQLKSVETSLKKLKAAKDKGDANKAVKALPKKTIFRDIAKGIGQVLDDFPGLLTKSGKVIEEGTEVVTDKIPNSGESALVVTVTVASAKPLLQKAKALKADIEQSQALVGEVKAGAEALQKKADALKDEDGAEGESEGGADEKAEETPAGGAGEKKEPEKEAEPVG